MSNAHDASTPQTPLHSETQTPSALKAAQNAHSVAESPTSTVPRNASLSNLTTVVSASIALRSAHHQHYNNLNNHADEQHMLHAESKEFQHKQYNHDINTATTASSNLPDSSPASTTQSHFVSPRSKLSPNPSKSQVSHRKDATSETPEFDILETSPKEIARQLTIMSADVFRKMSVSELESLSWTGPEKEKITPGIVQVTNHFNQIAIWVAQQILDAKEAKRRFQLICFFIRVAKFCLDFNNFDSVRSVVAGLQSTPVHRLERTWAMVGRRERSVFDKIAELASIENNNDAYRRRLAQAKPPCVPYLGTHLSDITFVYECLKKDKENPQRQKQYQDRLAQFRQLIHEIQEWQSTCTYPFTKIRTITEAIESNVISPERLRNTQDDHYKLSYQIEAKRETGAATGNGNNKMNDDGSGMHLSASIGRKFDFSLKSSPLSPLVTVAAVARWQQSTRRDKEMLSPSGSTYAISDDMLNKPMSIRSHVRSETNNGQEKSPPGTAGSTFSSASGSSTTMFITGTMANAPGTTSFNSSSIVTERDMQSWSLPHHKSARRERPRIEVLFSSNQQTTNLQDLSSTTQSIASSTIAPESSIMSPISTRFSITDTNTTETGARSIISPTWRSQDERKTSTISLTTSVSTVKQFARSYGRNSGRFRSQSSASDSIHRRNESEKNDTSIQRNIILPSSIAKDSYSQKVVKQIMKHLRKASRTRLSNDAPGSVHDVSVSKHSLFSNKHESDALHVPSIVSVFHHPDTHASSSITATPDANSVHSQPIRRHQRHTSDTSDYASRFDRDKQFDMDNQGSAHDFLDIQNDHDNGNGDTHTHHTNPSSSRDTGKPHTRYKPSQSMQKSVSDVEESDERLGDIDTDNIPTNSIPNQHDSTKQDFHETRLLSHNVREASIDDTDIPVFQQLKPSSYQRFGMLEENYLGARAGSVDVLRNTRKMSKSVGNQIQDMPFDDAINRQRYAISNSFDVLNSDRGKIDDSDRVGIDIVINDSAQGNQATEDDDKGDFLRTKSRGSDMNL